MDFGSWSLSIIAVSKQQDRKEGNGGCTDLLRLILWAEAAQWMRCDVVGNALQQIAFRICLCW